MDPIILDMHPSSEMSASIGGFMVQRKESQGASSAVKQPHSRPITSSTIASNNHGDLILIGVHGREPNK